MNYRFKTTPRSIQVEDLEQSWGKPAHARFWEKVQKTDECWLWLGGKNEHGYGVFWYEGRLQKAHRVAYKLLIAPVPASEFLCHRCDTPACVRPTHLFIGTQKDNMSDAASKGRCKPSGVCGSRHGRSKLTEAKVRLARQLRNKGWTWTRIAERFGVDHKTVWFALNGVTWKSV